ncbi:MULTISPECIES: molecular chaperone [Stenotrophomonas]|uniref:fimbrial biogenesis chaperone n=1 Tax=Stenotrophomonas TaxID=40323 RepID=UPI000DB50FB4|nr:MULTISPECIES: molecular chaperone [Stenotrophomonas]ELF4099787.1 molecular chaperone [Stenotrophomonas maltophilia]MBA0429528.1 molecular chaperone [Stenotrophomonas maltophilia]MDH0275347.1 molecular chaperone [Stenotrophomonas sp. GD04089]MDH1911412.1 molecular chaperone [Stenotrophomonas sp. GD03794]MRI45169.1 molecular chaperone [Stenotrophomonas sp. MH181796]
MRILLSLLALLLALPAAALDLVPTTLQLPAEGGHGELWLYNPGPHRWQGQVRILAWEQQTDAEELRASDQVLASPTRLDIPPGTRQRIWLLPRQPTPVAAEQAYRVVLAPSIPGLPRYSLPLFRGKPGPLAQPRLRAWTEFKPSQPSLRLSNTGTLHARLQDLTFVANDGRRTVLLPGLAGYVLAGRERHWALPARADGYIDGHFQARLPDGRMIDLTAPDPAIAASAPSGL